MHDWADENIDWSGISGSSLFIGLWLRRWFRMSVSDMKEKYGTARVYCSFGWSTFYQIFFPGYMWVKPWWPYKLDLFIGYNTPILEWINRIVIPVQKWAYAYRYKKAVQKWPHLYDEIVTGADWGELFEGVVPGYKHSDYWVEVKGDESTDSEDR